MAPKLVKCAGKVVVKGPTKGTQAAEKAIAKSSATRATIKKEEEESVPPTTTSTAMGKQAAQ
eukprot:1185169-Alexandrium_andersonii.AAC.1